MPYLKMEHKIISSAQRLQWADIYKGIGIILIVIGHVYHDFRSQIIFLFHVPMFFFISGLLFKVPGHFKDFFNKKIRQLLIPYVCFVLFDYIVHVALSIMHDPNQPAASTTLILGALKGGMWLNTWGLAYWFITCFFFTLVLEAYLLNKFSRRALVIIHFVMLCLGYINYYFFSTLYFYESINIVLVAAPFFYSGYLLKSVSLTSIKLTYAFLVAAIVIGVMCANHFLSWGFNMVFDMKPALYGIPFFSFVGSVACCITLIPVSQFIAKNKLFSYFFSEFGRASLVIMFFHEFILSGYPFPNTPHWNFVRAFLGVAGSYVAYLVFKRFAPTRKYLMGIG